MIYEDMNNYLKLDALYNDVNQGGQNVEFILEHEGIFPDTRPWQSVDLNQAIYLKISKSDNTYTGYYGINGIQWVMLGSTTASKIKKPQLGIYAITGNADPELNCIGNVPDIVTDFDYFRVFPRKNVYLPLVRR